MKLTPFQQSKIRNLAMATTELAVQMTGMSQLRAAKLESLKEHQLELLRLERPGQYSRMTEDELRAKIAAEKETIQRLKAACEEILARQSALNLDRGALASFVEGLLNYSDTRHEDFPEKIVYSARGVQ